MQWFDARLMGLALASGLVGLGYVNAEPIKWTVNGHLYEVVAAPNGITWDDARAAAEASGGYLATVTSPEENDFVFDLTDFPQYWYAPIIGNRGPWLGGFQSPPTTDPEANWQWVTGELWSYTNWASGQPNDSEDSDEDRLHFFEPSAGGARSPTWNDMLNSDPTGKPIAYVVEWVPEPSTCILMSIGGFVVLTHAFRRLSSATHGAA